MTARDLFVAVRSIRGSVASSRKLLVRFPKMYETTSTTPPLFLAHHDIIMRMLEDRRAYALYALKGFEKRVTKRNGRA